VVDTSSIRVQIPMGNSLGGSGSSGGFGSFGGLGGGSPFGETPAAEPKPEEPASGGMGLGFGSPPPGLGGN
jgi:hypothetical protein